MKKIILLMLTIISFATANTIVLTGEYLKEIKNPFNFLEKNNEVTIHPLKKEYILNVTNNLSKKEIYEYDLSKKNIPSEYKMNNSSLEKITDVFLKDNKRISAGNVSIELEDGNISLEYIENEEHEFHIILNNIVVSLRIKLIIDRKEIYLNIEMDKKLGNTIKDIKNTITFNDLKSTKLEDINKIMEYAIFKALKENLK